MSLAEEPWFEDYASGVGRWEYLALAEAQRPPAGAAAGTNDGVSKRR